MRKLNFAKRINDILDLKDQIPKDSSINTAVIGMLDPVVRGMWIAFNALFSDAGESYPVLRDRVIDFIGYDPYEDYENRRSVKSHEHEQNLVDGPTTHTV